MVCSSNYNQFQTFYVNSLIWWDIKHYTLNFVHITSLPKIIVVFLSCDNSNFMKFYDLCYMLRWHPLCNSFACMHAKTFLIHSWMRRFFNKIIYHKCDRPNLSQIIIFINSEMHYFYGLLSNFLILPSSLGYLSVI